MDVRDKERRKRFSDSITSIKRRFKWVSVDRAQISTTKIINRTERDRDRERKLTSV